MQPIKYASRIARLPVLAPDGGTVGVVADVVVGPPPVARTDAVEGAAEGPVVYGFVVTVPGRNIFLGSGRVARIDAEGVHLSSGALNLRRFTPRPSETLALDQLIDRALPGRGGERVNDVGIAASPHGGRGWELVAVDVIGPRAGLLRPVRTQRRVVGWEVLRPLLAERDDYEHLRQLHPVGVAGMLAELPAGQRAAAAAALDDDQLADVIEELPDEVQAELLAQLDVERAADVLEAMAPDDAADVLGDLQPGGRQRLLAAMESEDAETMRRLLAYSDDTAGGLMNPEPIVLTGRTTVAEALARLRDPDLTAAMAAQVFVVQPPAQTPTGAYRGLAGVQRLLREPPARPLRECLDPAPDPLRPDVAGRAVAVHMASYNLLAAPVCDADGHLLGVVTVDDVVDHLLPDGWRRT